MNIRTHAVGQVVPLNWRHSTLETEVLLLPKNEVFLPSSEPAIGRSSELSNDGWCRRTADLLLLVELE